MTDNRNFVQPSIDPRLRVLYLLVVAVGVFFVRAPEWMALVVASQITLWFVVRLPLRKLVRHLVKLWGFALLIVGSYALTGEDPAVDRWVDIPLWVFDLSINVSGTWLGVLMVLRIVCVVLASQIVRVGDPRSITVGLGRLGLPKGGSMALDAVLSMFGDDERGGGGHRRGGGGGGGGGRGGGGQRKRDVDTAGSSNGLSSVQPEGFWAALKRLWRGDVGPIVQRIERQIARAEHHMQDSTDNTTQDPNSRDLATIAGLSLTMLGIRAVKILPSIPFAPGHKLVILTPIYVVASLLTRGRWGATLTGSLMGTISFLMGDGRYGVFEIAKHITPGVLCDLFVPALSRIRWIPKPLVWSLFGGFVAAGRFATIFSITLLVQAPAVAYAILIPGLTVNVIFGVLSGYVTWHIVRGVERLQADSASDNR